MSGDELMRLVQETHTIVCNLEKQIASLIVKQAARQPAQPAGDVATDRDLDGQYGDPVIKKDPKRWEGDSYVGCRFSECPPEYLDEVANFKAWQADMDSRKGTKEADTKAKFNRLDGNRARGWAARKRAGWQPAPAQDDALPAADDDIPF